MQRRHCDRRQYFAELAETSRRHYVPLIKECVELSGDTSVLEIGCGDGGNLLPFAEAGCRCVGVDIAEVRIADATRIFADCGVNAEFVQANIYDLPALGGPFDVIICHDVYEHVDDKLGLLRAFEHYLRRGGIVFLAFPAWQMPFGGHQQICHGRIISKMPYIHLLPRMLYGGLLKAAGEGRDAVNELLSIKRTRAFPGYFEKLLKMTNFEIIRKEKWLINPHYEAKFGLRARLLPRMITGIPYFRNYLTTSCSYILRDNRPN